ncbi:MAG: VWA domain-containing protein, partial [Phycisphaerae bacterium]|nr:VWA domain-containing protein [Phycisphaerae bacterium]
MSILAAVFISPALAAAGAGLASVPIIIHLLNRRRFRRVIWAAMEWLLAAQRKNARRIRIEQLLLLLIRCLIMLLIGFALARPILGAMGLGHLFGQTRTVRVVVIDDSYSMNYGKNSAATSFAKAKAAAIQLVDMLDRDDAVSVILAGSPARKLIDDPSYEHKTVKEAIQGLKPSARGTDLGGALKLARTVLDRKDSPPAKQVVLIADRSRSAWQPQATGEAGDQAPAERLGPAIEEITRRATLNMIDVGEEDPSNLAITNLIARHAVAGADHQVYINATVN